MLTTIITNVVVALLSAFAGWLAKVFHIYLLDKKEQASDEAKTAAATKALLDAKTKEELDEAAKKIADNLSGR